MFGYAGNIHKKTKGDKIEPIKVLTQFEGAKVKPLLFKRQGRVYRDLNLNLVHHHREGERQIFNFHVSNQNGSFKLRFEPDLLLWFLEDEYADT